MICVTLSQPTHEALIHQHHQVADQGVELVELRVDLMQQDPDVFRLIENRPTPVVITCRRKEDGGAYVGGESQRRNILLSAIAAGAEYVDVECDTASAIPPSGSTKRIVSYHNFQETPENLDQIHAQLLACDPDIVKLATLAKSPKDNIRMLELVRESPVSTTAFCMGSFGLVSRVLTGKYGAPWTYASASEAEVVAPGQLSYETMIRRYRYHLIDRDTELYGVVGDPIEHSLSPHIHNAAFTQLEMNKVYLPFHVPVRQWKEFISAAQWLELKGLSVTIPHKQAAYHLAEVADETVQVTGACNTLLRKANRWEGYNTDGMAALESVGGATVTRNKTVLVLGAGGAAKAVGYALIQSGGRVIVTNRTHQRAEQLAEELVCDLVPWEKRISVQADMVVNCTSVGMFPHTEGSPFPTDAIKPGTIVFDTVYNPKWTRLLTEASERGCSVVAGREMFVLQAAGQFRIFTGKPAPLELMREVVDQVLDGQSAG